MLLLGWPHSPGCQGGGKEAEKPWTKEQVNSPPSEVFKTWVDKMLAEMMELGMFLLGAGD